jgi:alpha-tubulin suppressor-like RCC1 family protein
MRGVRITAAPRFIRGMPVALGLAAVVVTALATTLASGGAAVAASNPGGAARQAPAVSAFQADHWGYFFGDGVKSDLDVHLSPVSIRLPSIVVQLGTSNSTEYALLADGTVWAWGQGTNGQLGDGSTANSFTAPVQVQFPPGVRIAFLATDAMPYDTGLAVDTHGNAWGWGINRSGALCLGNARPQDVPVQLPLTDVTSLAGAAGHAVYDAGGTVYSCGAGTDGVLGDGSTKASMVPVRVSGLPAGQVTTLVSAFENAGALLADGRYYDWGNNAQGQLGDGVTGRRSSVPVPVNLPDASAVTQVAQGGSQAGNGQTLVMLADGALYGWGDDAYGQLGDGHTGTVQPSPRQFYPLPGVTYSTLATGGATSYGISTTGTVYAWGFNGQGEVGNGTRQTARFPVEVDAGAAYISSTAGNVEVAQSDSGVG